AAHMPAVPLAASHPGLPDQLQLQINLPELGPLRLDMQLDASGQAQLLLQTGSAALAQTLGEHTHQLVDAMRELGLVVQVDVRHDSGAAAGPGGSGGQMGSGQGGGQGVNQGANAPVYRQALPTAVVPAPAASRPAPSLTDNALSYYA
ncbi:MAG: flagellar hook-length control protein FliK, partial [Aquabacterium sp.]|nr:flagellar hook-length control protein FliK [Aquabacterium sp.]